MMGGKFQVKVTVASGNGVGANVVKPGKATNFKARSSTYGVTLNWDHVPGADAYIIYRRVGNTGSFSYLYVVSKNSFTDLKASTDSWNFYMIFPYYLVNGVRVCNTQSDYVYGRKMVQ